jgi:fatty acid synthase
MHRMPFNVRAAAACAEEEAVRPRLWLWGDLRDRAGVLGLGRCMRLEPHGNCVRFALDTSHPCSALTAAPAAKAAAVVLSGEEMVEIAGKLDMVSNVFRDGRHGTILSSVIEVGILRRHGTGRT